MADILEELDINAELVIALSADPQYLIDNAIIWPEWVVQQYKIRNKKWSFIITSYLGEIWTPTGMMVREQSSTPKRITAYNGIITKLKISLDRAIIKLSYEGNDNYILEKRYHKINDMEYQYYDNIRRYVYKKSCRVHDFPRKYRLIDDVNTSKPELSNTRFVDYFLDVNLQLVHFKNSEDVYTYSNGRTEIPFGYFLPPPRILTLISSKPIKKHKLDSIVKDDITPVERWSKYYSRYA